MERSFLKSFVIEKVSRNVSKAEFLKFDFFKIPYQAKIIF